MIKLIILFVSVISISLSTYRPMSKRTIDFGDNVCHYKEYDSYSSSYIEYVKPCPEGKYCHSTETTEYNLYTCETLPNNRKTIGESCSTEFECDDQLDCLQNSCQIKDNSPYNIYGSTPGENLCVSHCKSNKVPIRRDGVIYQSEECQNAPTNHDFNRFYYKNSEDTYVYACNGPYKVPGRINFKTRTSGDYEVDTIDYADIGSLPVGTPVYDKKACETGFALYFYGNGKLTKPDGVSDPVMYLHCANLKEVLSSSEVVYIDSGSEKIYNTGKISISTKYSGVLSFTKYKEEVKLEMFKNYREKLNSILTQCKSDYDKDYTEPYTCKNDELRKWFYFYNHPDEYMLYKDEDQIIDYLLQQNYANYRKTGSSRFINLKYIFYLLILLSL